LVAAHKVGVLTAAILLASALPIAIAGQIPDLARRDWSVNAQPSLATSPSSAKEVEGFVSWLLNEQGDPLCSFTFADLRGSGRLSLVIYTNESGWKACQEVKIIDQNSYASIKGPDFKSHTLLTSVTDGDARKMVRDLEHKGKLELVFDRGFLEQNHCAAHWPVIYAWTGADYEDVSHRFKSLYVEELAEVTRTLSSMESARRSGAVGSGRPNESQVNFDDEDCVKAEKTKIERLMGVSRNAGIEDAIKWAESARPADREFAIPILWDIGTPKAFKRLHSMMSDPDESVAGAAEFFWTDSPEAQKFMHTPPPLLKADWSIAAKQSLAARPPSKAAAAALSAYAENLKEGPAASSLPQDEDIESFLFVNLRRSGVLSLVIESDLNERHGGYNLQILDKTPAGVTRYWMSVDPGPDEVAQDLDGDGKYALVVDRRFIFQCEACCNPTFPLIYAWTGARYENVSERFPRFYQRRLETLRSEIETRRREWAEIEAQRRKWAAVAHAARKQVPPTARPPSAATNEEPVPEDCGKIEAAKIERFLGQSPNAGLDYAIALGKSAEWRDRMIAAEVLADIGTAQAITRLHTLTTDPENTVARTAKNVLIHAGFAPPAEIPER
jgi:hypothetical protein